MIYIALMPILVLFLVAMEICIRNPSGRGAVD